MKLRYNAAMTLDVGAGAAAVIHSFSANGLYDPDITGVGHQPMGFDQWMAFYGKYCVLESKATVTFFSTSDASSLAIVGIRLNRDYTLTHVTAPTICETGDVAYRPLAAVTGGNAVVQVTKRFRASETFGTPNVLGEDEFAGDASNNPARQYYFVTFVAPATPGVNIAAIDCQVQLEFDAVFSQPVEMTAS